MILDAGRPLDAPREATGLLPASLDSGSVANVVFSHPHMDHWGLIDELPRDWPVWTGAKSAELMRLSTELFGCRLDREIRTWDSRGGPLKIGGFTVTPFLTDHSGFDAYMLLIEGWGRRVFYTGDFRTHGRKAVLVERIIAQPPQGIDVLLMEGTNLRTDKPMISERALEDEFVALARATPGHVYVQWSAQNIDRTVTLYRAAKRSGRTLVVDLYGADVLERIAQGTRIPHPDSAFDLLKVVITPGGKRMYQRQGRDDFVDRMALGSGTSRRRLAEERGNGKLAFIMLRDSMLTDFARGGLGFTPDDAYAFSSWSGYLDPADPRSGWAQAEAAGAHTVKIHTSGHASPKALSAFASAMAPKAVIPVHGVAWDDPGIPLPPVKRLRDGESWAIP